MEDHDDLRRLTDECLRLGGFRVLAAASGREALAAAEAAGGPIALLLTDVVMSEMSGPRVVAEMRQRQPNLAVLYISGYTGESSEQLAMLGSDEKLLPKPFAVTELLGVVRQLIDRRDEA